mgnify:FL=1
MANANMQLDVENQELKEKFKTTNKGLQKAVLKRKKWKYRYQLARCEIKELKEKLDKYENHEDMTLFAMWCTEKVKDENMELKKQLEEKENIACDWKDSCLENAGKIEILETQQKAFIKFLENELLHARDYARDIAHYIEYVLRKHKEIVNGTERN